MKYRTEWKYICSDYDLDLLRPKISAVLQTDKNANKEIYNIHSLYFDDHVNSCAFDNDAGVNNRFKWRIRYYDDDLGFIKLEKKHKINDLCYKETCMINEEEYYKIVNGDAFSVFWKTNKRLVKDFCLDITTRLFRPKIIVDYERLAFVDPTLNIRITFDRNISGSLDTDRFLKKDYLRFPVQEDHRHILEVKFDDILPGYLEKIINTGEFQRNTFSKYYLCRLVLERNRL